MCQVACIDLKGVFNPGAPVAITCCLGTVRLPDQLEALMVEGGGGAAGMMHRNQTCASVCVCVCVCVCVFPSDYQTSVSFGDSIHTPSHKF